MKVSIVHADTCLSDYWSGHHLAHVQVPAYRRSFASVRRDIESEIRAGAIAGSDDTARLLAGDMLQPGEEDQADMLRRKVYAAIRRDIRPSVKGERLVFRDIEPSEDEETVWAFFVIVAED